MKPNETLWSSLLGNGHQNGHSINGVKTAGNNHLGKHGHEDELGEAHVATSVETPLRHDAFELDDQSKIDQIEGHFR